MRKGAVRFSDFGVQSMKIFFALLTGLLLCTSAVADDNDFRCFKSIGLKNPIRLQFTFPSTDHGLGSVSYQNGSGPIAVKQTAEKTLREVPNGRPWVFENVWTEVEPKGAGGRYVFVIQGAVISDFQYVRKDKKTFRFEEDLDATGDDGCNWKK